MERKHQELKVKRDRQQQSKGVSLGFRSLWCPHGVRLRGLRQVGKVVVS